MRSSEFRRAMREEFGESYAAVLIREHWLQALDATPQEALERGVSARTVWAVLCEELRVPHQRRHGRGLSDPPQLR